MQPRDPLVARVGGDLYASPDRVLEPAPQVLLERDVPGVVDEALVPLGYGPGELLSRLLVALRVDDVALAARGGLDRVAGQGLMEPRPAPWLLRVRAASVRGLAPPTQRTARSSSPLSRGRR